MLIKCRYDGICTHTRCKLIKSVTHDEINNLYKNNLSSKYD